MQSLTKISYLKCIKSSTKRKSGPLHPKQFTVNMEILSLPIQRNHVMDLYFFNIFNAYQTFN